MSQIYFDKLYLQAARSLAEHLHHYARERREEDKKKIAASHQELARIRMQEKEAQKQSGQ